MAFKDWLINDLNVHFDSFTSFRYQLLRKHAATGCINTLEIGSGGGVETLVLLKKKNRVTTVDIDEASLQRTIQKATRAGLIDNLTTASGHIINYHTDERFDQIVVCEVLEHIVDDLQVLKKLSKVAKPGALLILSSPTLHRGQLGDDEVQPIENGGHVRVGYDGPELDRMLEQVGFITVRRRFYCGFLGIAIRRFERSLRARFKMLAYPVSLLLRPIFSFIQRFGDDKFLQVTLAVKDKTQ